MALRQPAMRRTTRLALQTAMAVPSKPAMQRGMERTTVRLMEQPASVLKVAKAAAQVPRMAPRTRRPT